MGRPGDRSRHRVFMGQQASDSVLPGPGSVQSLSGTILVQQPGIPADVQLLDIGRGLAAVHRPKDAVLIHDLNHYHGRVLSIGQTCIRINMGQELGCIVLL